jgi:hypothetical protein
MAKTTKLLDPIHPGEILSEEFLRSRSASASIAWPVTWMFLRTGSTELFMEPGRSLRIRRCGWESISGLRRRCG